MSEMVPLYGFGGSGGGTGGTLTVTAPVGVTVTVSKDGKSKTKVADSSGVAVFKGLSGGEWTVTITDGSQKFSKPVTITTDYAVLISFSVIPDFTYTGDFEIVNDSNEPITVSQDNWKIRFLTSGTLTFTALNGAENGIDIFLVGGGGSSNGYGTFSGVRYYGGAGGGYTTTKKNIVPIANQSISIVVGASGGDSSYDSYTAAGGKHATNNNGANGGSGGAGCGDTNQYGAGGTDGGNGTTSSYGKAGTGQGSTTREFGESGGKLYSNGGQAYRGTPSGIKPVANNTGHGGYAGTKGGSGIVIIRNTREVA